MMKLTLNIRKLWEFFTLSEKNEEIQNSWLEYGKKLSTHLRYGLRTSEDFVLNAKLGYLLNIGKNISIPVIEDTREGIGYWTIELDFVIQ